jgi:Pentatricopeptide repeat domain
MKGFDVSIGVFVSFFLLTHTCIIAPFLSWIEPVDAWARSGQGGAAAQRAEALLTHMHELYSSGQHEELRPTNAIFNAVINAWARSREKIAPVRAEQILKWMQNLGDLGIQPDKYTFNTVIHAWAKAGGPEAAGKAQELLAKMHKMYQDGNINAKPDTISYNVVHRLFEMGDPDVKPNVVTYGAVIDSFAKSGERGAASRADNLLANMMQLHQSDPVRHSDLMPNTYVFNTVINCWAKSKEHDAASKAEEMLVVMSRKYAEGMTSLKPDNFTYTAVIDAWAKSGYRGAAARADQLLDKMESKYLAGDVDLKPNSYTYNAVICALAKSGEQGAAARAERVLQNMVNRHRSGGDDDIKPTVRAYCCVVRCPCHLPSSFSHSVCCCNTVDHQFQYCSGCMGKESRRPSGS